MYLPLPPYELTDACENITFLQIRLRAVTTSKINQKGLKLKLSIVLTTVIQFVFVRSIYHAINVTNNSEGPVGSRFLRREPITNKKAIIVLKHVFTGQLNVIVLIVKKLTACGFVLLYLPKHTWPVSRCRQPLHYIVHKLMTQI